MSGLDHLDSPVHSTTNEVPWSTIDPAVLSTANSSVHSTNVPTMLGNINPRVHGTFNQAVVPAVPVTDQMPMPMPPTGTSTAPSRPGANANGQRRPAAPAQARMHPAEKEFRCWKRALQVNGVCWAKIRRTEAKVAKAWGKLRTNGEEWERRCMADPQLWEACLASQAVAAHECQLAVRKAYESGTALLKKYRDEHKEVETYRDFQKMFGPW